MLNTTIINTILREVKSHKLPSADLCHLAEEMKEEAEAALARQHYARDAFFLRSLRTLATSLMNNDVTYEDTYAIVDQTLRLHAREVSGARNGQVAGDAPSKGTWAGQQRLRYIDLPN